MTGYDWAAIQAAVDNDGEFRYAAREWNGRFVLGLPERACAWTMRDGRVSDIDPDATVYGECDFRIDGPDEGWAELLCPDPRPFYQDVWPAVIHHGFTVTGDLGSFFAYHPAVRRILEALRRSLAREVSHDEV